MNKEYIIKFYKDDGTIEEKIFFLKPSATVKATALISKHFNASSTEELTKCLTNLTNDPIILNDVMNGMLRSNESDAVDWSLINTQQLMEVVTDFFSSYTSQMNTSTD